MKDEKAKTDREQPQHPTVPPPGAPKGPPVDEPEPLDGDPQGPGKNPPPPPPPPGGGG